VCSSDLTGGVPSVTENTTRLLDKEDQTNQ
jgi:hypothetical protein